MRELSLSQKSGCSNEMLVKHTVKDITHRVVAALSSKKNCILSLLKICYGGEVPSSYYHKQSDKADILMEESYQVECVKRGSALKLNYEVDAPGSILR